MKQYLQLLEDVLTNGTLKDDRTKTGTLSVFGRQVRYDLSAGFPLLTTKKLHIASILHELLWFLRGDTNIAYLKQHGVKIWDQWATPEGELGPIYGAQWRAWPDGEGGSIDQIAELIKNIRSNPSSRRLLFHAWNVAFLPDEQYKPWENAARGKMALPPCHLLYQFYVVNNKISCLLYIRSSDIFLGHPYNTASAAFLTHMIAEQCDLGVGELIIALGDVHLYLNHREQAHLQLKRTPRPLSQLVIKRKAASIFDYSFDDFAISGYDPHPHIAAPVAI